MAKYDKEKNLVSTEFIADEKKRAEGLNGPQEILNTFLEILKMFNPESIHNDCETKGGISAENLRKNIISEEYLSKDFLNKIENIVSTLSTLIDRVSKIPSQYEAADAALKAQIVEAYTELYNDLKNKGIDHTHANKTILDAITTEMLNNTLQSVTVESEEEIAALVKTNYKVFHIKMIDNTVSSGNGLGGNIVITPTIGGTTYKQFYIFNKAEKHTVGGLSGAGSSEYVQLKLSDTGIFKRTVTVNSDVNETVTFEDWKTIFETFIVTLHTNDGETVETVDKTYSEIKEAYQSGKPVKLLFLGAGDYFDLLSVQYDAIYFSRIVNGTTNIVVKIGINIGDVVIYNYNLAEKYDSDIVPTKNSKNLITSGELYNNDMWRLISETEITEEDITAAGDTGISVMAVGDENEFLFKEYSELYVDIYIPASSELNSKNHTSSLGFGNNPTEYTVVGGRYELLRFQNASSLGYSIVYTRRYFAKYKIELDENGNAVFIYHYPTYNGDIETYPCSVYSTGKLMTDFNTNKRKYLSFHTGLYGEKFYFPAGSYMKVYGRRKFKNETNN